ncbi:hypothetical protein M407DRAFT_246220 [Tulasnella calospora MUT 4182]|uniref:UBX domain-containing protein n=1 Tax=Tulasnella calospora MUT 4182 TaxID=1051891 RepID=A0A0C3LCV4_9AGAM|nr:hypothetical protein M407DRAFT_246220 [Tulasnella calospora MUT 4182]
MSDREPLLSFGFPEDRVTSALDFLVENEDKPVPSDLGAVTEQKLPASEAAGTGDADDGDAAALQAALGMSMGTTGAAEGSTGGEGGSSGGNVRSIKCSICGKIFRDTTLANFHAEKSGHDQFEESTEEIKALTEEDKKKRLAELRQRALEKKAIKSVQEAIPQKMDEAKAKAALKAQIEADKRERAEKAAREKALREGSDYFLGKLRFSDNVPGRSSIPTPAATSQPAASASTVKGSEYKDTRLQIRLLAGGAPLIATLLSDSPLSAVAEFVAGQSLAYNVDTVSFTMQFPRKSSTQADMKKSLRDLSLTPSAVLIAS